MLELLGLLMYLNQAQVRLILFVLLAIFIIFWVASRLYEILTSRAKEISKIPRLSAASFFVLVAIAILMLAFLPPSVLTARVLPLSGMLSLIGILIAVCGILFAIWARIHLGSNWAGMPMLKKGQTLITTGPYSIVRHPIYTGITVWVLGSWIALGDFYGTTLLILTVIFCWSRIRTEEKLMLDNFGKEYANYKKRVKAFIPFIY